MDETGTGVVLVVLFSILEAIKGPAVWSYDEIKKSKSVFHTSSKIQI